MQQRTGNKAPVRKKGRVSLPPVVAPPRGSPFFGISGTNAPAKDTKIPNLTEKVTLAKTRKAALTHGGLLTPTQQKAASDAGKTLAAHKQAKKAAAPPPEKPSKPLARKPAGVPTLLPLPNSAPFKVPPPSAPASTSLPVPSSGRRGATPSGPRAGMAAAEAEKPKGNLLGALGNAASVGLGTALEGVASIPGTLTTPMRLGQTHTAAEDVKPTHLAPALIDTTKRLAVASNAAADKLQGAGLNLPKTIPSVDLVPTAGAASRTNYTPQALVAAGLTPAQTTKFRNLALKRGWYAGEVDGLVGLDLIKHAYSSPPPLALRVLQNFGSGVIRTGGLANVPVAAAQEISSGHGLRFAKELGNVTAQQFGGMIQHPGQAAVSDPYAFLPMAGGTLKTLGGIGGKVVEKMGREAAERAVTHAVTGEVIPRGPVARNLYTASGQAIADKAAGRSAFLSRKLDAQRVDKLVADVSNETAPEHHAVQTAYASAFKKVGAKRAAILESINKAGGKPEKILAKYTADGNARQVKHWTAVVAASKNLTEKDHAFLDAHKAMGAHTTASNVELGRFGETAGIYRAHQPLILSDAHAGDPNAMRVQALHDEWITTLRKTDDPAILDPLHGAYDHAVREFAQTHFDTGGIEPTRVAYTPPLPSPTQTSRYRTGTGGRVRFNRRIPKQPPSTGAAFESGNYLIDPKVALRENLQAQRLRTSVGLTSDKSLQSIGSKPIERGVLIPEGYTFTPKQNPATVGKVISDLHDQPVGAHDYYHQEASVRDRFAKSLEHDKQEAGEYSKTEGWLVPTGSFNRILDHTRPESRTAYDKAMRQYQRIMISTFPSTVLGNTVGSVPLALAAGAGPKSFRKAMESTSASAHIRGHGFQGDISLVPHSLHGRGVAGNLAADVRNPLGKSMNKMRRANVVGEDFSRDAAYFSQALKGAKKRSAELGYKDVNDYLRDMASGKVDPHVRDQAIAHAIKFAGDAAKPATKLGNKLGKVILFPQWLQHMTKLMLVTLPLHHPRRLALINALAAYGDQYRKEHGVLPSWMTEFAPLFDHIVGKNTFTRVAGLGQLAPQGTASGIFDTLNQSNLTWPERLTSLANPPVAAAINSGVIQPIKNASGDYPVDLPRYALNQALYTVPGMSKFFPRTGMEADSLPWSPRPFTYTNGTRKTKWNPDNSLPADQRPGVRPVGGLLGTASRVFGLPLYDVPSKGPINDATVKKAIKKAEPKSKGWGS